MQSLEGELSKAQQADHSHRLQDSSNIVTDKRKELQLYKGQVLTCFTHSRKVCCRFKKDMENNKMTVGVCASFPC